MCKALDSLQSDVHIQAPTQDGSQANQLTISPFVAEASRQPKLLRHVDTLFGFSNYWMAETGNLLSKRNSMTEKLIRLNHCADET